MAYKYVQNNYPTYFRYSERDLPNEVIKPKFIKKNIYEDLPIKVEADANFEDVDAPARFIPERRYWISAFERRPILPELRFGELVQRWK